MSAPRRAEGGSGVGTDERSPRGERWGMLYAVVIGALAAEIALLSWLSERFR